MLKQFTEKKLPGPNVREYPLIGFLIGTNDAQLLRKSK